MSCPDVQDSELFNEAVMNSDRLDSASELINFAAVVLEGTKMAVGAAF